MAILGEALFRLGIDASQFRGELEKAEAQTRGFAQQAERHLGGIGGFLKSAAVQAAGFAAAMVGVELAGRAFGLIKDSIIGMNASLETSTLQFQTLMGDADLARKHVESLFKFAAETPFETAPIIEASRLLHTFGGAALNTEENLRLVGDAAAATSNQINEVAFWVGRAYSMIQAGKPFGEAAMRLQEMGILSATARARLEELQDSGASAEVVWAAFRGELSRFNGAMKLQAGTWQGLTSTISDNIQILAATAFRPLFDLLKEGAKALADFLQSERVQQFAQRVAGAIQGLIDRAREFLPSIQQLFSSFSEPGAASGLLAILNPLGALAREVLPALMPLFQTLAQVLAQLATTVGPPVAQLIAQIGAVLRDAIAQVLPYVVQLFQQLAPVFGQILAALVPLISQGLQVLISTILPPLINLLSQVLSWLANNETAVKVLAGALVVLVAVMNPIPATIMGIIAVVGLLSQHWDSIKAKTLEVWGSIRDFLTQNWQEILSIASLVLLGPAGLVVLFTTNAFGIRDKVTEAMEQLKTQLEGIWNAAKEALEGIWNALKGAGEAIFGALRDALSGIADSARDLVVSAFGAMKDGVVGAVSALRDLAAGAMGNARDLVAGAADTARDLVVGAFSAMRQGVGMVLWDLLVTVRGIPGQILDALGNLGSLLWDAGRALIQGLIDGIKSKAGDLKDALGGLKDWIPKWKGPITDDVRLLVPQGRAIMKGLISGIESSLPELRFSLGTVMEVLGGVEVPVPRPAPAAVGPTFNVTIYAGSYEAGRAAAAGFYDELRSRGILP